MLRTFMHRYEFVEKNDQKEKKFLYDLHKESDEFKVC